MLKAKLLAVVFGLLMSGVVAACPSQVFDREGGLRWIVGGEFRGLNVGATGNGVRSFVRTGRTTSAFLLGHRIELGNWIVAGRAGGNSIFNYRGTGTRGYVGAVRDATAILVPVR